MHAWLTDITLQSIIADSYYAFVNSRQKLQRLCVCVFFQAVFVFTFLSEKELQRILVKSDQEEDFRLYSFISFISMDHEVNRNSFCVTF